MKLSATGISTYLKNPRLFYWQYVFQHPDYPDSVGIVPVGKSPDRYDQDLVFGDVWAQFTHRFYQGMGYEENYTISREELEERLGGDWLGAKERNALLTALSKLAPQYYEMFSPGDRLQSEVEVETNTFVARLDGWMEGNIIHECKATSRAKSLSFQVANYEDSVQAKFYAVVTGAKGICYELAFKDAPHTIFRAPVKEFDPAKVKAWEKEFYRLQNHIANMSLPDFYPVWFCNSERCNFVSKYRATVCPYRELCNGSQDYSGFIPRKQLTGEAKCQ